MNKIDEIVSMEWELFTNLKNEGGRASCQDNKPEFEINRKSQFEAWGENVVNSYYNDLITASNEGRNLLFEKYAFMMEYTHFSEFEKIKNYLPFQDEKKLKVISLIENIIMKWEEEFREKYPNISKNARPMENVNEGELASARVYLIGEHKSYSYITNLYFYDYIKNLDYNLVEKIFLNIAKKKSYNSLEEFENFLK